MVYSRIKVPKGNPPLPLGDRGKVMGLATNHRLLVAFKDGGKWKVSPGQISRTRCHKNGVVKDCGSYLLEI